MRAMLFPNPIQRYLLDQAQNKDESKIWLRFCGVGLCNMLLLGLPLGSAARSKIYNLCKPSIDRAPVGRIPVVVIASGRTDGVCAFVRRYRSCRQVRQTRLTSFLARWPSLLRRGAPSKSQRTTPPVGKPLAEACGRRDRGLLTERQTDRRDIRITKLRSNCGVQVGMVQRQPLIRDRVCVPSHV